jgi:hypothetical protein
MTFKRLVLNFPGFEQTSPEAQLDRIRHSAQKTGEIWNFTFERLHVEHDNNANFATCETRSNGWGWQSDARIVQFSWNDIIRDYEKISHPRGIITNFPKFLAFFADGTIWRYWRASKRYWGFTIFPLLLLAIFIAIAWLASYGLATVLFDPGWMKFLAVLLLTICLSLLLCKWPGDRLYLLLTINDWGFARDMVNRSNPVIESRYREFADVIARELQSADYDEIIISGHSFGSVWAVAALALALEKQPEMLRGKEVTFLALGSSLLKIALAPGAQFLRDWTARIAAEPDLFWHEIQTKDDIIAFYKADPFSELNVQIDSANFRIDRVNYKKAMERKRYRAMRTSFYRTHRQYILYQDKQVTFDYMLRLFGPLTAKKLAMQPDSVQMIASTMPQKANNN